MNWFSAYKRSAVAALVFALLVPFISPEPATARMMYVEVKAPLTREQLTKYGYLPRIAEADARIYEYRFFALIRLRGERFCDRSKCLTYVVLDCETAVCPYANALVGPAFAVTDMFEIRSNMYDDYLQLFSFCSLSINGTMASFLVGKRNVTVQWLSDEACDAEK
jgi:hypothetical protein